MANSAGTDSGSGSRSGSGSGSPCGACKFLRRKCVSDCIFAPYFRCDDGAARFASIHKVFGASNVSKLLSHVPAQDRCEAVVTIAYEAQARIRDPVYGCVAHILALQHQVLAIIQCSFLNAVNCNVALRCVLASFDLTDVGVFLGCDSASTGDASQRSVSSWYGGISSDVCCRSMAGEQAASRALNMASGSHIQAGNLPCPRRARLVAALMGCQCKRRAAMRSSQLNPS
ncbi:uncharacterized protein A4U43_C07F18640 [Asparagus officinalis]|uniref:LOB domain-containing protein n=1 Tax=Asparagus officinalis TaxID=4686 RepID=A0A5P1EG05_ASPOF|nr:uncharacterized protein A4U43_C07F18640 [Asparagus officinalis]